MKSFIFITNEGFTYQPNSDSPEPDIENCQVVGFSVGENEEDAFSNLIKENDYLLGTNFNELICIELKHEDYYQYAKYFSLNDIKENKKFKKD